LNLGRSAQNLPNIQLALITINEADTNLANVDVGAPFVDLGVVKVKDSRVDLMV